MDLSSRRISESGEQYTTAGRDFHAQSSDDERARRQSVASLGSLDDAPRDRLVALLNDIISGRHVDCSSAQEARDALLNGTLFVPHAMLHLSESQGQKALRSSQVPAANTGSGGLRPSLLSDPFLHDTLSSLAQLSSGGGSGAQVRMRVDDAAGAVVPAAAVQVNASRLALLPSQQERIEALPLAVQAAVLAVGITTAPEVHVLADMLQSVPSYDFDAFALYAATGGAPVTALVALLFVKLDLVDTFRLDLAAVSRFTRALEARMPRNGYHNAEHIADVVQSMAILLTGGLQDLANLRDDPLCVLALLLAAVVHDTEHPGLTADHLIAVGHPWALLYNDRSVLEQHHLCEAFALLRTPGLDWTRALDTAQATRLRGLVIKLVMSTDMKEHFQLLGAFGTLLHKARHQASRQRRRRRQSERGTADATSGSVGFGGEGTAMDAVQGLTEAETLLVLQMALKVADLGHLRAPLDIHRRWVAGLCSEFYAQGDLEKRLGMTVNDHMSRELAAEMPAALPESQVGFFDYIALPLLQHWARATGAKRWLDRVLSNYNFWMDERQRTLALPSQGPEAFTQFVQAHREPAQRIAGLPNALTIPEELSTERGASSRGAEWGRASSLHSAGAARKHTSSDGDDVLSKQQQSAEMHALRELISSLAEASVSGDAEGETTDMCSWCGLPPLVDSVQRLSLAARRAAATAAASAAVKVLSSAPIPSPSRSRHDTSPPREESDSARRRARFSETDAAFGPRGCFLKFEDFRNGADPTRVHSWRRHRTRAGIASAEPTAYDDGALAVLDHLSSGSALQRLRMPASANEKKSVASSSAREQPLCFACSVSLSDGEADTYDDVTSTATSLSNHGAGTHGVADALMHHSHETAAASTFTVGTPGTLCDSDERFGELTVR